MKEAPLSKEEKLALEHERLAGLWQYEHEYSQYSLICGIDEVGRGPLAGPVYAGAVILPKDIELLYLNDSKKLTEKRREKLSAEIRECAIAWGIGSTDAERIDEIGIVPATFEAMAKAVAAMAVQPDILFVDAFHIKTLEQYPQVPIIKGDQKSASIAAASIIAKVERDHLMMELDEKYPGYGFSSNKGYGSKAHLEALVRQGPCEIHRRSFIHNYT